MIAQSEQSTLDYREVILEHKKLNIGWYVKQNWFFMFVILLFSSVEMNLFMRISALTLTGHANCQFRWWTRTTQEIIGRKTGWTELKAYSSSTHHSTCLSRTTFSHIKHIKCYETHCIKMKKGKKYRKINGL